MSYSIVCLNCGNEKLSRYRTTKFCSDQCRGKYNKKNRGHKQKCKQCNTTFYNYKERTFCSYECNVKFLRDNPTPIQVYKPRPKRIKSCINCNKEYDTHQDRSKYCSYKCKYEYKVKMKPISNIKCKECGKWFSTTNKLKVFCSEKCGDKNYYRRKEMLRRERIVSNGKVHWDISIERLLRRDGHSCYLCGETVNTKTDHNDDYYPSIEHVVPVAKGGTHTWDNVKLAHRRCNYLKSDEV